MPGLDPSLECVMHVLDGHVHLVIAVISGMHHVVWDIEALAHTSSSSFAPSAPSVASVSCPPSSSSPYSRPARHCYNYPTLTNLFVKQPVRIFLLFFCRQCLPVWFDLQCL